MAAMPANAQTTPTSCVRFLEGCEGISPGVIGSSGRVLSPVGSAASLYQNEASGYKYAMGPDGRLCAKPGPDAETFERLYDEHSRRLLAVARRILRDVTLAQDVVQDVFLGLWRDPSRYDARRGPIGHYLCMVTRSKALDVVRETQVAGRATDRLISLAKADDGPAELKPAVAAEQHARSVVVRRALMRLPDAQREAIVLAYWGGLTAEEIAASSSTPVGTVKSRIRLGVLKLRNQCTPELPRAA
jgi:RNA polymerase sigma-70 factor (ECF subfamily)